ncbi:unnamed protein product [Amoebophrya sp. A120]|nr:unnamed protein product [Amoebophrya sp. A120]|eukprot:GSA120T00006760001.1
MTVAGEAVSNPVSQEIIASSGEHEKKETKRMIREKDTKAADYDHLRLPDIWELKGDYYQVLGHAWDHEVKDFKVIYRPLYHCTAKPDRFQAHYLAASHFARWESKFHKVVYASRREYEELVPEKVRKFVLAGPFWHDPMWTAERGFAERTAPRRREDGETRHRHSVVPAKVVKVESMMISSTREVGDVPSTDTGHREVVVGDKTQDPPLPRGDEMTKPSSQPAENAQEDDNATCSLGTRTHEKKDFMLQEHEDEARLSC